MPSVKVSASTILGEFEQAHSELVGTAVILTDGKAGTVEDVWLDEARHRHQSCRYPQQLLARLALNLHS